MIEKFRYGTKEIIVTAIGSALSVLTYYLEMGLLEALPQATGVLEFMHLRILVVAICAVFFGPMAGMLVGLGGELLINLIFMTSTNYPVITTIGVYGFFIGLYFGKNHYNPNVFTTKTFFDFNAVQLIAIIFCSMMLLPLLWFLADNLNLSEGIIEGGKVVIVNSVIIGIICPFIMGIVYLVRHPQKQAGS